MGTVSLQPDDSRNPNPARVDLSLFIKDFFPVNIQIALEFKALIIFL
ncbi:hypothetical protein ALP36_102924 [Pseudomonas syringae pv. coriandricola]|uniref:Uncharacterized protein n=3 Tax=Pseudomonas syringae group TaxID=136849 RepID=A0A0N8SWE4_PSESX|nr:Unknown protein sequence [Pseudomonas syringae pv. maculicola]KPC05329.1 Unknown protein sequence [Pseudomonas amygdali pv. lachrymans]KPY65760.1 hypothetical protein ALO94_101096 [Pseudomonas syringae pv. spinaceae]RMM14643.1 hypothetical protein ALQ85_102645 [Pseudomonas syringae]RMR27408.1 hypothetical protein ALP89_102665 [Pseudomonas syringae pv. persicae]RMR27949.1 hypothetical protein ALP87_102845 [Pseudomonas syringae pv. coriandricola]